MLAFAAVVGSAACAPTADGGAVELSWKLRPASGPLINNDGPFIGCDSGEPHAGVVTEIQLTWDDGDKTESPFWDCSAGHGVTGFDLPPGSALISVRPLCADPADPRNNVPADPATYVAPAPVQRASIVGDTISLGAVELVLQVSSCTKQACICQAATP